MFLVNWFYGILNSLGLAMKSGKSACCSDAAVSALQMMACDGVRFTRGWCLSRSLVPGAQRKERNAMDGVPAVVRLNVIEYLFLTVSLMLSTKYAGT